MSNRYQWDSTKGSWQRPSTITKAQRDENWDRIFGKKDKLDPEQIEARESVCKACQGKGGCMDAGWYYGCPECGK